MNKIDTTLKEEWAELPGYKGKYLVSNFGDVKSFKRYRHGIIRKLSKSRKGYLVLLLNKNDGGKQFRIHRLVATLFIPMVEGKCQVNHIDGNKENNRVDNLEWCNNSENGKHSFRVLGRKPTAYWKGKMSPRNKNFKKTNE